MANEAYLQFVRDGDQASRQAELKEFAGPNAAAYLQVYEKMVMEANRPAGEKPKFSLFSAGFNVGAFFLGPVWFFYRKMWGWAWGFVGLLIVVGIIPGTNRVGLPVGIVLGLYGNRLYVTHAIAKLQKMRAAGGGGPLVPEQVAAAGGVSKVAGWIAGVILVGLTAIAIYAMIAIGDR